MTQHQINPQPQLGILNQGYLRKKGFLSKMWKKRFIVLTSTTLHWFKRVEGYDLFGDELGNVQILTITNIKALAVLDNVEGFFFQLEAEEGITGNFIRQFRCSTKKERDTWVKQIRKVKRNLTLGQLSYESLESPLGSQRRSLRDRGIAKKSSSPHTPQNNPPPPSLLSSSLRKRSLDQYLQSYGDKITPSNSNSNSNSNSIRTPPPIFPMMLLSPTQQILSSVMDETISASYGRGSRPLYLSLSKSDQRPAQLVFSSSQVANFTYGQLCEMSVVEVSEWNGMNKIHKQTN